MKTIDFVDFISKFTVMSSFSGQEKELLKITADSREVAPGTVFFCIKGLNSDGHDFIEAAFEKGAELVVGEKEWSGKNYICVNSVKEALKAVLPAFYGEPDKKMKMIGVTGTNGKTSTTFIIENLLNLFYKKFDAPMVGMGPYNPHPETPLTLTGTPYPSAERRFALGLKMIALLRLLMPDINIAAATALEVLDPRGREKGLLSGANVIMPNITPEEQMVKYNLYDRKTLLRDCPSSVDPKKRDKHICLNCVFPFCSLGDNLNGKKIVIGYGRWGDSRHFQKK